MVDIQQRLKSYYLTAIVSLVVAVVGFSYNTWRLEVSESNTVIRAAAFQVLVELAEFEQIIYAAHYDQNPAQGNPRNAWVKVGLIDDLCMLIDPAVVREAQSLKALWSGSWEELPVSRQVTDKLVEQIDRVRNEIKQVLIELD